VAGWVLIAQGACLVATLAGSWWLLRHVDASVASAARRYPAYANQAGNVRLAIAASLKLRMMYAALIAPLLFIGGCRIVRRRNRLSRSTAGLLCLVTALACVATSCLNFMMLSGNEPLLEVVPSPGPFGVADDAIALTLILTPLSTLAAAVLVVVSRMPSPVTAAAETAPVT
jgi:hypothetical protein